MIIIFFCFQFGKYYNGFSSRNPPPSASLGVWDPHLKSFYRYMHAQSEKRVVDSLYLKRRVDAACAGGVLRRRGGPSTRAAVSASERFGFFSGDVPPHFNCSLNILGSAGVLMSYYQLAYHYVERNYLHLLAPLISLFC